MATGPEHYAEAERLLDKARVPYVVTLPDCTSKSAVDQIKSLLTNLGMDETLIGTESVRIDVTPILLAAQAHATLALTAAQVDDQADEIGWDSGPSWNKVVS